MRFTFIIVLCVAFGFSPISSFLDDPSLNEIPVDDESPSEEENLKTIDQDRKNETNETGESASEKESSKIIDDDQEEIESILVQKSLEDIYKNSAEAYLDEDWDRCIHGFNLAIERYKEYKNAVIKCRKDCREIASGSQPIFPSNMDDLHFYEKKVRETLCLLTCNQDYRDVHGQNSLKRLSRAIEKKFVQLAPYDYLQMCYYQKNRSQDAANAVFTFLTANPEHEISKKNLRYYIDRPDVEESKVINLEAEPFVKYYINGVNAYNEERYKNVILNIEQSLKLYLAAEENCRIYCEGHFDQGWLPEFTPSIANHFTFCLKCKQRCPLNLNQVNGGYHADLLPSHYHYLQIAYYKVGDLKNACAAVSSYLLFFPSDETMLKNEAYYANLPKVEKQYFTPRQEALEYIKRQEYEKRLSRFIFEEFQALAPRLNGTKSDEEITNEKSEEQLAHRPSFGQSSLEFSNNRSIGMENKKMIEHWNKKSNHEIRVIADENDLGGKLRYVADGFINETECKNLIHLAKIGAVEGDGYEGQTKPLSVYERFEGLTLGRASLLVYFGLLEPEILELALSSSEEVRDHMQNYFNLDRPLYFTYTHLACRTALPESTMDRQDLSHAIHADNCVIVENETCISEWPAYTFRDYSAILYLNDDFQGGEFVFAADPKARIIQSTVEPRCGRIVAFSASGNNLHGVRGVLQGSRCALALWLTFDHENIESERLMARAIVERVRTAGVTNLENEEIVNASNYEDALYGLFETDKKLSTLYEVLRKSRSSY